MLYFLKRLLITLLLLSSPLYAAAFQNGSFENNNSLWTNDGSGFDSLTTSDTKLTGWTIENDAGGIEWHNNASIAKDGDYYLRISEGSKISQTLDTTIGTTYNVSFDIRTFLAGQPLARRRYNIQIRENNNSGTLLLNIVCTGDLNDTSIWVNCSKSFTATTTTTYIKIQISGSYVNYTYIDNLTVTAPSPIFTNTNSSVYPDDPTGQNLKGIPGQAMVFDSGIQNTGGAADANTFKLHIDIPTQIDIQQNSLVFQDARQAIAGATGNVATNYTTTTSSGLTCSSCWEYSINSGTGGPWTSSPSTSGSYVASDSQTYLPNVRALRLSPTGAFADGTSSATGFRFYYKGIVK